MDGGENGSTKRGPGTDRTNESNASQQNNTDSAEPRANVEDMSITFERAQENVTVEAGVNSSADAKTGGAPDEGEVIEYLEIETSAPDSEIAGANFDVRVSEDQRERLGVEPDNVAVYRYHNGTWQTLETTHIGGDRYNVTTPGFSVFAVGTAIEYNNARITATEITPGDSVTGMINVTNNGQAETTAELILQSETDTISKKSTSIPANASMRATVSGAVTSPGRYHIIINGEDAGTLRVTAPDANKLAATPEAQLSDSTTKTSTTGDGGPGFGFVAAVVALLVGVLARRRVS
jgi:PGF-pre-PGF domain-containing protein/PGF-CTERM protein